MSIKKSLEKLKAAMKQSMMAPDDVSLPPLCPKEHCFANLNRGGALGTHCARYDTLYEKQADGSCKRVGHSEQIVYPAPCKSAYGHTPMCP